MEEFSLQDLCTIIILIATTITAITTIVSVIKNPAKKYKEKHDAETKKMIVETLTEILPDILQKHDLEVRDRYKADRDRYLHEIESSVLMDVQGELNQIKILGLQYEALVISAKDVLREKIVKIYSSNKDTKTLTMLEKEKLDQFYTDYKALKGNSYIDKYYKRMEKWEVLNDDDDDDDML